jgi:hypothetical protein
MSKKKALHEIVKSFCLYKLLILNSYSIALLSTCFKNIQQHIHIMLFAMESILFICYLSY